MGAETGRMHGDGVHVEACRREGGMWLVREGGGCWQVRSGNGERVFWVVVRRGVGYRFGSGGEVRGGRRERHGRGGKGEWRDGRAGRDEGW